MDSNKIEIYKNNSREVICTISGITSISGYTSVLTIKENLFDDSVITSITGVTTSATVCTFTLLPEHTNQTAGTYHYDVVLYDLTNNYTVVQSNIILLESVKF